ncbi:MAG: NAD-dependent epimerase/dehydratase family protein [Phycisphaeraceae bacterium]
MTIDWPALHSPDAFRNTRVLVTGGAGFIGSHLVDALIALKAHVTVLDDLSTGDAGNLAEARDHAPDRLRLVEASILDAAALADAARGARYVFHLAALASVPDSIERPAAYHEINATGTLHVLEAARACGVERVIFAASSAAYGNADALPLAESIPPQPLSPYAASKLAGEALLAAYAHSYEALDTVSLRYFNIFGPRQNANSAYAAVIAAFAQALTSGQAPTIFGDGSQSRDFTYVANAVHANLLAARAPAPLAGQVVNVATGVRTTVNALAEQMSPLMGRGGVAPRYAPARTGDALHSVADLARARALLGYEPVVDFPAGLKATAEWYASLAPAPGGGPGGAVTGGDR